METDEYLPLSSLNTFFYCNRRFFLQQVERAWQDNAYTVEGTAAHHRVHDPAQSNFNDLHLPVVRGMILVSHRLRLTGVADLVEFQPTLQGEIPYPVEYKRGRRQRWRNDDAQVCAQALCLEEMLGIPVPKGAIYHVTSQRRRQVIFDDALRRQTEQACLQAHALMLQQRAPPAELRPRCKGCSLHEICLPELMTSTQFAAYQRRLYQPAPDAD